jgi:hypothetical protein
MPDIANALKFQRKLMGVENSYLKQIHDYRAETRRVLLDILDRDGIERNAIRRMVAEVESLSRRVTSLAADKSNDIRATVANYIRQQLRLAKAAGLADTADINPVLNAGLSVAQDGEQSYMTNTSAWVTQLENSLQTQAAKLRLSQASDQEIKDRLLSETLADGRASVWLAGTNQANIEESGNVWSYGIGLLAAYMMIYNEQQPDVVYMKQAIATIDKRTTECCLRVHGQIQSLDDPFRLDGTPRYADEVQDPPFHWYCRTSEALYHEEFENFGIPTDEMIDAAQAELTARKKTKTRVEIYPSHATARRIT